MKPDQFTLSTVLSAFARLEFLEKGNQVHAHIIRTRFEAFACVSNALVTMYAKCGSIDVAEQAFNKLPEHYGVSWSGIIAGYAQHGCGKETLKLYDQMLRGGMKPDNITSIGILRPCSHSGLVDAGCHYFDSIDNCITLSADHFSCMFDPLGHGGHLDEEEDICLSGALLNTCRMDGNMKLGKCVAECFFELDPLNRATCVLLSNIYVDAGTWNDVAKVRMMRGRDITKKPTCC
eukprot:Gb_35785 [translate_table: standard]